jgi:hypothetical protein
MLKDITTLRDGKSRQLERNEAIAHAALTHRERRFNYLFREKKQIETNNFLTADRRVRGDDLYSVGTG